MAAGNVVFNRFLDPDLSLDKTDQDPIYKNTRIRAFANSGSGPDQAGLGH